MSEVKNKPSTSKGKLAIGKKLKISSSSFNAKKKSHIQTAIEALGGVYEENFTFDTNILITGSILSNKYRTACALGVALVIDKWLFESY